MLSLFVCLCLPQVSVHRLTVDGGVRSADHKAYLLSVADEYNVDPVAMAGRRRIVADPEFEVVTGYGYCIDPAIGDEHRCRYWTVPNEESVDACAKALASKRGPNVVVKKEGGNFTITLPGQTGTRRWVDSDFRYDDGILAVSGMASPSIHKLSMKKIREWVAIGRGKHQMVAVAPQALPEKLRYALLGEVGRHAMSALQRRDGESSEAYALRRTVGDASLRLMRLGVEGVEEIVAWTDWPAVKGDQPWRAKVQVKLRRSSELSRISGALTTFGSVAMPDGEGLIGAARLMLKVPKQLREPAAIVVENVPSIKSTDLATALGNTIRDGRLQVAGLAQSIEDSPRVVGAMRLAEGFPKLSSFAEPLKGFAAVSASSTVTESPLSSERRRDSSTVSSWNWVSMKATCLQSSDRIQTTNLTGQISPSAVAAARCHFWISQSI